MGKISGVAGKLMYGSVTVANITQWSMTGLSIPVTSAPTAFGDTGVKVKEVSDLPDAGQLEFSGNYDPADTNGQRALTALCKAGTHITNIYLYANTSTFWRVASGGYLIVTKADPVTLARSAYGTISFTCEVSSEAMEQVGTGS